MQIIVSMMKYIRSNLKLWLIGIFVPAIASMATNVFFANRLQNFSELLQGTNPDFQQIIHMLLLTMLGMVLLSSIDDIGRYVFVLYETTTENDLRDDMYTGLIHASIKRLKQFNQGEMLTRYNTDVEQSTKIVSGDIQGIVYPIVVGGGYLIAVLLTNGWIGLIMLVLSIGVIVLNYMLLQRKISAQKAILHANDEYVLNCTNAIHGKMSIRQYAAKHMVNSNLDDAALALYQRERQMISIQVQKLLTSDTLANLCTFMLTPLACVLAVQGYMEVSVVLFIHQICRYFISYTQNFANAYMQLKTHALSYQRISPMIMMPTEEADRGMIREEIESDHQSEEKPLGLISFDHVSVTYEEHQVLRDVTATIQPGNITVIVGESGSGKSTLVKALMQMIEYQGKIFIGGRDCAELPLSTIRDAISYSPEHSDLFQLTIQENIQLGNSNQSIENIRQVLQKSAAPESNEFMQRDAGENGTSLSGGQRQKVSLARTLLKNAPIMIFDEPTAALDAESEDVVLTTMKELSTEGKSVIIITHKTSTMNIADAMYEMKNGILIQRK